MKGVDEIREAIVESLKEENIILDDIYYGEEDGVKTLFIVVDAEVVDLKMCEKATEIINPIIDSLNIGDEEYVLDVSGKVSNCER